MTRRSWAEGRCLGTCKRWAVRCRRTTPPSGEYVTCGIPIEVWSDFHADINPDAVNEVPVTLFEQAS